MQIGINHTKVYEIFPAVEKYYWKQVQTLKCFELINYLKIIIHEVEKERDRKRKCVANEQPDEVI